MEVSEFKRLFLPCSNKLYLVAWRLTHNRQEAEDLVQETMLKLWTQRNKLHELKNSEAFSVRTLHNIFIDQNRKKHLAETDSPPEEMTLKANECDASEMMQQKETGVIVTRLIAKLPKQQRDIITLKDIDDFSYEEIAQQTGLSMINIRVHLSRARKQIRVWIR
ncbi:MAG: RNA polymerase sigma factor [Prevotella sp.]|nr:RNA polymerase sigma factor [Prevotella sp.]